MSDEVQNARVNVSVADECWSKVNQHFVRQVVEAVLEQEGPFDETELTVRLTTDAEIQDLNWTYRDVDAPTDVLSFGIGDAPAIVLPGSKVEQLGDVVISIEAADRQAAEYGHTRERELGWLIAHGVLQLLGYTHHAPAPAQLMRKREEMALHRLGLLRPDGAAES